jgi:hypothetical protein
MAAAVEADRPGEEGSYANDVVTSGNGRGSCCWVVPFGTNESAAAGPVGGDANSVKHMLLARRLRNPDDDKERCCCCIPCSREDSLTDRMVLVSTLDKKVPGENLPEDSPSRAGLVMSMSTFVTTESGD